MKLKTALISSSGVNIALLLATGLIVFGVFVKLTSGFDILLSSNDRNIKSSDIVQQELATIFSVLKKEVGIVKSGIGFLKGTRTSLQGVEGNINRIAAAMQEVSDGIEEEYEGMDEAVNEEMIFVLEDVANELLDLQSSINRETKVIVNQSNIELNQLVENLISTIESLIKQISAIEELKKMFTEFKVDLTKSNELSREFSSILLTSKFVVTILLAITAILVIGIAGFLFREIMKPLNLAIENIDSIAGGNLDKEFSPEHSKIDAESEFGFLLTKLDEMRKTIKSRNAEITNSLKENMRIKSALDQSEQTLFLVDENQDILYLTEKTKQYFFENLNKYKEFSGDFSPVVGKSLSKILEKSFNKEDLNDMEMRAQVGKIEASNLSVKIDTMPIFDENNKLLCVLVELNDITKQQENIKAISNVVDSAKRGALDVELKLANFDESEKVIAQGLNDLVANNKSVVAEVQKVASNLAVGDFSSYVENPYQGVYATLFDDLNSSVKKLSGFLKNIIQSADIVGNASSELASANKMTSDMTQSQNTYVTSIKQTVDVLSEKVNQTVKVTNELEESSNSSMNLVSSSNEIMQNVHGAMLKIDKQNKQIEQFTDTIDEIAFQTNLLSLNAAIEAARAGESGKGFAVVASEVRKLSIRSSNAAKDIGGNIQDITNCINDGVSLAEKANSSMKFILEAVENVASNMNTLNDAFDEQKEQLSQVNKYAVELDDISNKNAAIVEETAATAEQLKDQAKDMQQSVAIFKF